MVWTLYLFVYQFVAEVCICGVSFYLAILTWRSVQFRSRAHRKLQRMVPQVFCLSIQRNSSCQKVSECSIRSDYSIDNLYGHHLSAIDSLLTSGGQRFLGCTILFF